MPLPLRLRPATYIGLGAALTGSALYITYRPRTIPGSEDASVPPPLRNGVFHSPSFPAIKSRAEQIAALRASSPGDNEAPSSTSSLLLSASSAAASSASSAADSLGFTSLSKRLFSSSDKESPALASAPEAAVSPSSTNAAADDDDDDDNVYDLLIIGGGATGTGIALDAATRGLKVALVERDDFSAGTSSKSTKLVHGGVRYLEKAVWELDYSQYKLVRDALRERRYFLDTAPHLSSWLPIMLPIDRWWKAPYFYVGTKMYDILAGSENIESSYFLTKSKALDVFPMLRNTDLFGALVYYDGAHNDSRMNVSLAMTAALYGATVVNHMEVTSLLKDSTGKLIGANVKDTLEGADAKPITVRARGIINATGPFTDSIRKLDDDKAPALVQGSSGVHIVLPGYFSPANMGLIDPSTSDGRVVFFLPWQGSTIAGTTDSPTPITFNPAATEPEIDWIISEIKKCLDPGITIRRSDVRAAWSGIRPLVRDPKATNTEGLVRSHLVTSSPSGLLSCSGGKWTTYREMAEDTVDEAVKLFGLSPAGIAQAPVVSAQPTEDVPFTPSADATLDGTCQTHKVRLVGAHGFSKTLFIHLIQQYGIETEVAQHLARDYGDRAWEVARLSSETGARFPKRGARLARQYPYVDGEVRYAVRHEYAQTAVDVLARRTRLAFLDVKGALEALPQVIDIMAAELGWDGGRKAREWDEAVRYMETMGLPAERRGITRQAVEAVLEKGRF